jgi:hypothetical protein
MIVLSEEIQSADITKRLWGLDKGTAIVPDHLVTVIIVEEGYQVLQYVWAGSHITIED